MTHAQQVEAFVADVDRLVNRYRHEFDLTYIEVIGVLEMKKLLLARELIHAQPPRAPGGDA